MVSPDAFVRETHALFALASRLDNRAVHLNVGPLEELCRLLLPHLQACFVKGFHQQSNVRFAEPPAEVTGRGGIGQSVCSDCIEKHFVITTQFNVLQSLAATQQVVCHVQHVIGFRVRPVNLQQVQPRIDRRLQTKPLNQPVHRTNAAARNAADLIRHLEPDVATANNR